jgi:hypothetical protein
MCGMLLVVASLHLRFGGEWTLLLFEQLLTVLPLNYSSCKTLTTVMVAWSCQDWTTWPPEPGEQWRMLLLGCKQQC